ncbi:MAG: hypothetical protein ACXAC7_05770 [Candidatus Hodarchaeales archaeon]|jgi:flavin-dependent dehydrogenase
MITIVGGNISGLSTALALHEKGIECEVYEKTIWEKPCGGAFGINFVNILKNLDIKVPIRKIEAVTVTNGFKTIEHIPAPMYISSRYAIQKELYELVIKKGIPVHLGNLINFNKDFNKLSALTVVASGINRFSLLALNRKKFNDLARLKYIFIKGTSDSNYNECIFYLLPRKKGYAWYFPSTSINGMNYVDIGVGGLDSDTDWKKVLDDFIKWLWRKYKLRFQYRSKDIRGWGLPFGMEKLTNNVLWRKHKGKLFVGVGDAIELVHPAFGSGIEVSWISGQHFATACVPKRDKLFDPVIYFQLIEQELNTHTRSRNSIFVTKILRSSIVNAMSLFIPASLISFYFQLIKSRNISLDFKNFKIKSNH